MNGDLRSLDEKMMRPTDIRWYAAVFFSGSHFPE